MTGGGAGASLPDKYRRFREDALAFLPESRVFTDPLRTLAYGTDASFYRLIPKIVVQAQTEEEISRTLELAARHATPVTFRAAGTSLSGQAITESVLVRLGDGWRGCAISSDGARVTAGPGLTGGQVNARLASLGRKIGPDPASVNSAMIGGIAANNASGMCCGVSQNSYRTLAGMRVILADGTLLDTGEETSRLAFTQSHKTLLDRIEDLARRTKADGPLAQTIRDKFKIKNTTGYSLNALVDYEDPIDILQHLMIGSEGTLGFIAEITYRTVEDPPYKASALMLFADIGTACEAVAVLKSEPVAAVELMDRAALRSVEDKPGMPDDLRALPAEAAALLVETRAADEARLGEQVERIADALAKVETLAPLRFTSEPAEYTVYWNIRKGLFPSVGAMRETGTTVIIEDVAVAVPKLAAAVVDLQALFRKFDYDEAIIFGHALEGNVHFVFTQDFGTAREVERYRRFMDEVCHLIVETYSGSLKAEHSTGRNMAPFVEMEWGSVAYGVMREIKAIFDPANILNPGVILNDDPQIHVKNLKPLFPVDPLVDKCIECGFCEATCPSRALSLTPRQRIVGLREIARLAASRQETGQGTGPEAALRGLYQYDGVESCAGDGLCALSCPVGIDTGRMMKTLRGRAAGSLEHRVGRLLARHYGAATGVMRLGLGAMSLTQAVLGDGILSRMNAVARRLSRGRLPQWTPASPSASPPHARRVPTTTGDRVVYFPSCASRVMGPARGDSEQEPLPAKTATLLEKAGYSAVYPEGLESLCCGMPFESKGLFEAADEKLRELERALLEASRGGRDPIAFDTSPCAFRARRNASEALRVLDITEVVHDLLMDRLSFTRRPETVALHATCSVRKMGLESKLKTLAEACAQEVIVPDDIQCCGFAGDKGFTTPELNESALRHLRQALPERCAAGYSTSRTCEIGLSHHSGRSYRSIAYLVDRCTESKAVGAMDRTASDTARTAN